jgi:hypothetical protein
MSAKPSIILFEDDLNERPTIVEGLQKAFKDHANVLIFAAKSEDRLNKTFETLLIGDLKPNLDAIRLILCDQDLSRMEGYGGLSAETVTSVARIEGLSIGLYGRGNSDVMADRVKQKRQFLERRFFLEFGSKSNLDTFCKEARGIFEGCSQVRDFVENTIFRRFKKGTRPKSGTPSSWMCELLGRPEIQTRLSLYGAGDQQYLEGLATVNALTEPKISCRIISSELSYWLWESILRFPGLLLNQIAAASFLNIDENDFAKKEVQSLFKKALFKGPFSNVASRWWQDDLQNILKQSKAKSGLEFAKGKGLSTISRCKCSVEPKEDAGYYCMLSEKPVSLKNSMGKIPYFPPGADLARIANPEFAKVAPWAGLES